MSDSAWCDLKSKGGILELHDLCHNPKSERQKQIFFILNQFQLEGAGFKNTVKKTFEEFEKMWNVFIELGLKIATLSFSASEKPQPAEITS